MYSSLKCTILVKVKVDIKEKKVLSIQRENPMTKELKMDILL